jgi:hypothetical protein
MTAVIAEACVERSEETDWLSERMHPEIKMLCLDREYNALTKRGSSNASLTFRHERQR